MNANLLFEQAMRNGMVERTADQSYSVVSIQHIIDIAQRDQDTLEDVIVGKNSVFGLSPNFIYIFDNGKLFRFPIAQAQMVRIDPGSHDGNNLNIEIAGRSFGLSLPAAERDEFFLNDLPQENADPNAPTMNTVAAQPEASDVFAAESTLADENPHTVSTGTVEVEPPSRSEETKGSAFGTSVKEPKKGGRKFGKKWIAVISMLVVILIATFTVFATSGGSDEVEAEGDSGKTVAVDAYSQLTVEGISEIVSPATESYWATTKDVRKGDTTSADSVAAKVTELKEAMDSLESYKDDGGELYELGSDYLSQMHKNLQAFQDYLESTDTAEQQTIYQTAISELDSIREAEESFYSLLNKARENYDLEAYGYISTEMNEDTINAIEGILTEANTDYNAMIKDMRKQTSKYGSRNITSEINDDRRELINLEAYQRRGGDLYTAAVDSMNAYIDSLKAFYDAYENGYNEEIFNETLAGVDSTNAVYDTYVTELNKQKEALGMEVTEVASTKDGETALTESTVRTIYSMVNEIQKDYDTQIADIRKNGKVWSISADSPSTLISNINSTKIDLEDYEKVGGDLYTAAQTYLDVLKANENLFLDASQNSWDSDLVSLGLSDWETNVAEGKKAYTEALNAAREEVGLRTYDLDS